MADIGGVVLTRLLRQSKIGRQKRRTKFGDKLFHRVAFIAKALAPEAAVQPRRVPRPVRQLVRESRVIAFSVLEGFKERHLHESDATL